MSKLVLMSIILSVVNVDGHVDITFSKQKGTLYIYIDVKNSYEEAITFCDSLNGSVGMIRDAEEQRMVTSMTRTSDVWLGVHEIGKRMRIFVDRSGKHISYTNWEPSDQMVIVVMAVALR